MPFILFFLLPVLLCLTALGLIRFARWGLTVGELVLIIVMSFVPVFNLFLFVILCVSLLVETGVLNKRIWKKGEK